MKSISNKIILLIFAISATLAIGLGIVAYQYFFIGQLSFTTISKYLLVSAITTILFAVLVNIFLLKKIEKILTTVKRFRAVSTTNTFVNSIEDENEIAHLQTEIMALADERKNEIERLKKLEMYRKEFLGNVSHELKTPIFSIQGYILTLLDGGLEDKTINEKFLKRAAQGVDRMINIVEDLEAITQLEAGELTIEPERFDINALAKDIADAEEMKATTKGIILNLPNDNKPVLVNADRFRIRQVLLNLIVNSIKYGK